jgi:hypothetical protein
MKYTEIEELNYKTEVPKGLLLAKRTENDNWAVLWAGEISYVSSDFTTLLRHTDEEDEVEFVEGWDREWDLVNGDFWEVMKRHTKNVIEISLQDACLADFCENGIRVFLENSSGFDAAFIERLIKIYRADDLLNKNDKNVYFKKYRFILDADKMYEHLENFVIEKIYE